MSIFSHWFGWNSVCCHTTCWFVKADAKFICTSNVQWRELCWQDFMKCMFNNVMNQNTCKAICFKLDVMLKTTNVFSLIPVWMTLIFTQVHRVMGKLELVQSSVVKSYEITKIFKMGDYVRKMTVKKSYKSFEYGSFWAFALLVLMLSRWHAFIF